VASDLRVRVGYVSDTVANIVVACLSNVAPTATCSGGSVAVSALSERVASKLYTGTVTITGLTANTKYTYSVTQDGVTRNGSFKTAPADQTTDFSFIVSTCDFRQLRSEGTYSNMRNLVSSSELPVLFRAHIDDVTYADTTNVTDTFTGLTSSGDPQDTGLVSDFDIAWAAQIGLCPSEGKWRDADRQWINENLPLVASGGDHMIEDNHCRGQITDGAFAADYHGCNRGAGATVPNLEENAINSWNAFFGDVNPANLASAARADSMTWGMQVGPVRMVSADSNMNSAPYTVTTGVGDTTGDFLGATQITNIFNYLDVSTVPFKIMFMETGFAKSGQPWHGWWTTEADAWKTSLDSKANLNGTSGHFIGMYGDSHAQQTFEFDTFWGFGAGMIDSHCVYAQAGTVEWSGTRRFWRGAESTDPDIGQRIIGGFMHVLVHASKSPQEIEVRHIDGNTGNTMMGYTLVSGTANNQFVPKRYSGIGI